MREKSKIRNPKSKIGCQGWNYADWTTGAGGATVFYPRGTRSDRMLALYAGIFDSVEVDSTFYAIPPAATIESWYQKTPPDFTFSLKMPQEITHELMLRKPSFEIAEAFCERAAELREKLASVLIQLPPAFEANRENAQNLRAFLANLPRSVRFAVEFRDRRWLVDWTFAELEKNRVALCLVEGSWIPRDEMFAAIEKPTADFFYLRFMGERDLTRFDRVCRPQKANLQVWAEEIKKINAGDVYVYFSNFYEGHAPVSANKLKELLGQEAIRPETLENQGSLF